MKGKGIPIYSKAIGDRSGAAATHVYLYFCAGFGAGVGVAGCEVVCDGFTPESTEAGPVRREAKIDSVIDVTIKIIADHVVAFVKAVAAPRGPNAVWLPWPPKAAAKSPLLPLWSNTTAIRNRQTIT